MPATIVRKRFFIGSFPPQLGKNVNKNCLYLEVGRRISFWHVSIAG
jgi:hypothetical protein